MKKNKAGLFRRVCAVALSIAVLAGGFGMKPALAGEKDRRAVWISTVYNADFPKTKNNAEAQKKEFTEKLDRIKEMGLNTVVVQIRPKADALYESETEPWSAVLTGTQGQYPGYDPMKFMIEETHKRGMEFHAWMNPYRVTTSAKEVGSLSPFNMAKLHPEWVFAYNGALYFDPARDEVKRYLCRTVEEIVEKYDVDAIHFDDYFYPSQYPLPEGEGREGNAANTRREHVNDLVEGVYKTIKHTDRSVEFGISPMGIWKNASSDPAGSATKGAEGYYNVYGDALKWVKEGWVDYIVPQIYWEQGNPAADYETLVKWWSDAVKGTGVDLYIGQGVYKDNVAKEIASQMRVNDKYEVKGSFFFSLRDLLDNRQGCADQIKKYYREEPPVLPKPEEGQKPEKPEKPEKPPVIPDEDKEDDRPVVIEKKTAYAARASVEVDGKPVEFQTYTIDDYTYFKLRDIASAVNGTPKQFDTLWNSEAGSIVIIPDAAYSAAPPKVPAKYGDAQALTSTAKLYMNGRRQTARAYTINDYTYYKLRDVAKLTDLDISWNEATATIGIGTAK